MAYRWRPSASQRRAFAEKMSNDSSFAAAYKERKEQKAEARRSGSRFNYASAGGNYVPTKYQHDMSYTFLSTELTREQNEACTMVISGYSCNEKVHHDYIHIVNELIRAHNAQ